MSGDPQVRRYKRRTKMVLPVRVKLPGAAARDLKVAYTLDATDRGVRLAGLEADVKVDDVIEIHNRTKRALFRIVWIKPSDKASERQIGAVCVEEKNIWSVDFPADAQENEQKK